MNIHVWFIFITCIVLASAAEYNKEHGRERYMRLFGIAFIVVFTILMGLLVTTDGKGV